MHVLVLPYLARSWRVVGSVPVDGSIVSVGVEDLTRPSQRQGESSSQHIPLSRDGTSASFTSGGSEVPQRTQCSLRDGFSKAQSAHIRACSCASLGRRQQE
jgi:hypothetical protein